MISKCRTVSLPWTFATQTLEFFTINKNSERLLRGKVESAIFSINIFSARVRVCEPFWRRDRSLEDLWNPPSTAQNRRRVERAFSQIIRLELILAGFRHDPGRELCSRMDLEKVLLTHSARKALTTLPYPITVTPTMKGTWP